MIRPKILNDREKGFLEGFLDADGSIVFGKGDSRSRSSIVIELVFVNNSRNILDKIQEILRSKKKYVIAKTSAGNNHYRLSYSPNTCRWLLPQLKLVVKEEKRKLALEILNAIKWGNRGYELINKKRFEKRLEDIKSRENEEISIKEKRRYRDITELL